MECPAAARVSNAKRPPGAVADVLYGVAWQTCFGGPLGASAGNPGAALTCLAWPRAGLRCVTYHDRSRPSIGEYEGHRGA